MTETFLRLSEVQVVKQQDEWKGGDDSEEEQASELIAVRSAVASRLQRKTGTKPTVGRSQTRRLDEENTSDTTDSVGLAWTSLAHARV